MILGKLSRTAIEAPKSSCKAIYQLARLCQTPQNVAQAVIWLHTSRAAPGQNDFWGLRRKIFIDPNLVQIGESKYEGVLNELH